MAGEVSDAVKKCCGILKNASSDTEKFAALFMVTKLVKGKHATPAAKKAIFEAIGFDFLKRLLLTNDVPVDCPPSIYRSLALSILSVFCTEEELATKPALLEHVPIFLDMVKQSDDEDFEDNLMSVGEAYNCLKGIAAFQPGQEALIKANAIAKLSEIYTQAGFQSDEAINLVGILAGHVGSNCWDVANPKPFHMLMNKLSLDFSTDQDKRKFELCDALGSLIFNCPRKFVETAGNETWPSSIYKGLTDILQSKISPAQRDPALILAANMLDLFGVEWALSDEEKAKQFLLLLIQLAAIEVRMQLDGKNLKSANAHAKLITACFIILELCINYVATDQMELEQKEKQTLYTGLKGAFTAVIGFILKISAEKNKPSPDEKLFVCAAVRVLVAWLAQETSALRPQVYQVLPFLIELANETFHAYKARKTAEKAGTFNEAERNPISNVDILRIMLPALCHLTVEDQSRKILLDRKEDAVLFEFLEYHWTIVNYKRPPVPRSERLKVLNSPKLELSPEILEEQKDSRLAMISTCNVLMNLTVLEPKYVEESDLYNNILRFMFDNLPELKDIPENLVLHGNLSILGLLLLKQLSKKVKKNDFSICRYIQATIRFLWNAYNIDESNDPTALVVSMAYKEHWMELMELWFLGMQTMSAVLAQIPWVSEFAIESGWAEGTIQTLKQVKVGTLPPNVKSAYEDFLCHLVDANEGVVDVLKKAEALKISDVLVRQYGVPNDEAATACNGYLRAFRNCPENPSMSLDAWRCCLWRQALGEKHKHLADVAYRDWLRLRYQHLSLSPDTLNMLFTLRQHYLLGLITNGPSKSQWEKINNLGLQPLFDIILVSGDLPWEKPDYKIFEEACRYLGVGPHQCLMVGDKLETDILGGINSALGGTVWVPLGNDRKVEDGDPSPDYVLSDVTRLRDILPNDPGLLKLRKRRSKLVFSMPDLDDCSSNGSDGS